MVKRELTEPAEELLGDLWVAREEQRVPHGVGDGPEVNELVEAGLILRDAHGAALTEAGEVEAAAIVRRERLAERLLADVLNVGDTLATEAACKFEHLLRRGIDNQICTLLGHPRVCPHGSPIPRGECCRSKTEDATRVVSALADMATGDSGVIAYIQSQRHEHLHRLMTMGALPGAPIALRQRFPSFVFDLGNGQVAVDEDTARDIYVRLDGRTHAETGRPHWLARRLRHARTRRSRGRP
jgi:DtxR family Mn-dependent transcriptional regulator